MLIGQRFRWIKSNKVFFITKTHRTLYILSMWKFTLQNPCVWWWQDTSPGAEVLVTAMNQLWDPRWPLHWDFRLFVHKMKWTKGSQGPFYIQLFEFPIHILKLYTQNDLLCFAEEANDRRKVASNHISKNQKEIHILF